MIALIAAMDQNRLIGRDNALPWHLPADLRYFKETTTGHVVVMGRKTFESIGKPLPNRINVVLTSQPDYFAPGCLTVRSTDEVLWLTDKARQIFVIGGAEVFRQFLPLADRLYLTHIDHAFAGDVYFPAFDPGDWELVFAKQGEKDAENPYDHRFHVYARRR
jgi:dihydrofolate reductase